MILSKYRIFP